VWKPNNSRNSGREAMMGAQFNFRLFGYWIEWTPFAYLRINKKVDGTHTIVYEKWRD